MRPSAYESRLREDIAAEIRTDITPCKQKSNPSHSDSCAVCHYNDGMNRAADVVVRPLRR